MALSSVSYLGDGVNKTYSITFPYLSKAHVLVFVGDVADTTFTWLTSASIQTTTVPASGTTILIKRTTPTAPLVDFVDGSTLTESLLDTSTLQPLYVSEESKDISVNALQLDFNGSKYDASNKVIKNVATPVNASDAVNKTYVDVTIPASVSSAASSAASALASAVSAAASAALAMAASFITSITGSIKVPASTTANRDASPSTGFFRFNTDLVKFEGYNGASWGSVGGGATGGGTDAVFVENDQVVNNNYTLTSGKNAMSAGQITIANGVTVTIPTGATWSIT